MEIQNASKIPRQSNQLLKFNVKSLRWKSRNLTNQPGKSYDRKSEVIAFVVYAGIDVISNKDYILIQIRSLSEVLNWSSVE